MVRLKIQTKGYVTQPNIRDDSSIITHCVVESPQDIVFVLKCYETTLSPVA